MIIKVDGKIDKSVLERLIKRLEEENNVKVKPIIGAEYSILGLVGDISSIDIKHIQSFKNLIKEQVENFIQKIQL